MKDKMFKNTIFIVLILLFSSCHEKNEEQDNINAILNNEAIYKKLL